MLEGKLFRTLLEQRSYDSNGRRGGLDYSCGDAFNKVIEGRALLISGGCTSLRGE